MDSEISVVYGGNPNLWEKDVRVESSSHKIASQKMIITFELSWGGIFGRFRTRMSYISDPIDDLDATLFRVIPKWHTHADYWYLRLCWNNSSDGEAASVRAKEI